ncbi:hypothetical protein HPB49_004520 [Dermacentor silvarum]|uniref:Uncharacterized protein n=1 Tax=Dermacentor silvarum TaxID=543639 RepID=A0ACB8CVR0_DERSI|nr:hypothetical protein HPB49_004520 [Dermacentor silvarum]
MEDLVEGEIISPQDYHPGEWQTVLRAYRNRAPASNSSTKPNSTASVQAKPNASNAGAPTDDASVTIPAAFKETPQLLRTTRAVVQKSKQLAALPVGTIRVVFRPRGGLSLDKLPAPSLLQALRTSPSCSVMGELYDVCPLPKTGLCPRCGEKHETQEDPCKPKCILCGGDHLTGTGSCKARTPQPRRQTVRKPKTAVPTAKDFPLLAPHQYRQRAWTKPTSTPPTSPREEEIAHLREEAVEGKVEILDAVAQKLLDLLHVKLV